MTDTIPKQGIASGTTANPMHTKAQNPSATLQERWFRFEPNQTEDVIFILDASESAASHRDNIINYCRETLAALPASIRARLYFLGNSQPYPAQQLSTHAASWFQDNASRCSLVTPILETLPLQDSFAIVILGAGTVYDLYDWLETPFKEQLLLVNWGESLQTDNELAELQNPSVATLRQRLHDPLANISFSGDGFLPIRWNNTSYRRVRDDNGRMMLIGERLETLALELRLLLPKGTPLIVERNYASGRQNRTELSTQPPPSTSEPAAGKLTLAETKRFYQACQKRHYTCPHCDKPHSWDTLYCQEGLSILGELIYPSLREYKGFVRLCVQQKSVYYFHHADSLYLGNGVAAIQNQNRIERVRFDSTTGSWVADGGTLSPYHPLGGKCYALFL
ncbi:MAG TPA: hypothetical protein ENI48_11215 [Thioploca sp.]|nr:hypothetical protein [Thioploca sp.]